MLKKQGKSIFQDYVFGAAKRTGGACKETTTKQLYRKNVGECSKKKLRREILLSHDGSLGEQAELRVEEKKIPSSF